MPADISTLKWDSFLKGYDYASRYKHAKMESSRYKHAKMESSRYKHAKMGQFSV